jgi:hypothetical protein
MRLFTVPVSHVSEVTLQGFLRRAEVDAEKSWALLGWLRLHGADEFSVNPMVIEGRASPRLDHFDALLAPHALVPSDREHLSAPTPKELVRPTLTWQLNDETEAVLRSTFPRGLFEYPASEDSGGWIEEPSFYRSGELVLSILSHESEGMIRLPVEEYHQASKELAIVFHPSAEWL